MHFEVGQDGSIRPLELPSIPDPEDIPKWAQGGEPPGPVLGLEWHGLKHEYGVDPFEQGRELRVAVLGDRGVGKSCLIIRFTDARYEGDAKIKIKPGESRARTVQHDTSGREGLPKQVTLSLTEIPGVV